MRHNYRFGLGPQEMLLLRNLRSKGFALALIPPYQVGNALNRKTIEDQMLKAAKQIIRLIDESQEGVILK